MFESLLTLGFLFGVGLQPSSERGQSYFEVPRLQASFAYTNEEGDKAKVSLKGTDNRDTTSKKNQIELDKAYLEIHSAFEDSIQLEVGLIPNKWIQGQERLWDFNYWGNDSEVFLKRYKYISSADLGVNIIWPATNTTTWILSLVNGEGNAKAENGPRKDVSLILALEDETWQSAWGYVRGAYEDYESNVNLKERVMGRISYLGSSFQFSLEGFQGQDTSLPLVQGAVAENLDLPTSPVSLVKSQGASLSILFEGSKYWSFKLRGDALNPAVGYTDRGLVSGTIAAVNKWSKSIEQAFIYTRTDYQENHSLQAQIREKVLWAIRWETP